MKTPLLLIALLLVAAPALAEENWQLKYWQLMQSHIEAQMEISRLHYANNKQVVEQKLSALVNKPEAAPVPEKGHKTPTGD